MSDEISTIYRGMKIIFGRNSKQWGCGEIAYYNVDLTKVEKAIDRHFLKLRKENKVEAYMFRMHDFEKIDIVDFVQTVGVRSGSNKIHNNSYDHLVNIVCEPSFSQSKLKKTVRKDVTLCRLIPVTENNLTMLEKWRDNELEIKRLREENEKFANAIPRCDLGHIAKLVDIKKGQEHE